MFNYDGVDEVDYVISSSSGESDRFEKRKWRLKRVKCISRENTYIIFT